MHRRVMCLTIFCLRDVSQYFCPASCRRSCHISVTDTRVVFLSSSPPPPLIQLFWFLSLWFILCCTQEGSGSHEKTWRDLIFSMHSYICLCVCVCVYVCLYIYVWSPSLWYLLKASSRSSQSQQHVHWQESHSQQHRGSSGSGGFNFSHCITTC